MKKTKEIKIMINKESKIYNEFNNSQLSNKLSNYILEQSRGVSLSDNIILNIYPNFQMTEEEIKTHKPTIVQVGENNEIISYGK